jgi:hypothetical protein
VRRCQSCSEETRLGLSREIPNSDLLISVLYQ